MQMNEGVRIVVELEVLDIARFKEIVEAAVVICNDETGTVAYDWYLDEEARTGRLYEAYTSVDALKQHAKGRVFTELAPEFMEVCRLTQLDFFGDVGSMTGQQPLGPSRYWGPAIAAVAN